MVSPRMRSAIKEVTYILMFISLLVLSFYIGRSYGRFERQLLDIPKVPGVVKPRPPAKPQRREYLAYVPASEAINGPATEVPVFS